MSRPKPEAYASLRFVGWELDPSDVTRLLVLPPDHAHRAGDLRIGRTRKGKVKTYSPYSAGLWSMSSERWVDGANLGTHIAWILAEIEPKRPQIERLLSQGIKADIFCFWLADHEPIVPKEIRRRAERLGLRIDIDQYPLTYD